MSIGQSYKQANGTLASLLGSDVPAVLVVTVNARTSWYVDFFSAGSLVNLVPLP